jgi:hypothetical protein
MPATVVKQSDAAKLSPLELLALKLCGRRSDDTRDEIQPGRDLEVDFLVHVQGTIQVSEDTTQNRAKKPSQELLLAHVAKMLTDSSQGATWIAIKESLQNLATVNGGSLPAIEEGYVASAKTLVTKLSPIQQIDVSGQTRGSFKLGVVDAGTISETVTKALAPLVQHTRLIRLES